MKRRTAFWAMIIAVIGFAAWGCGGVASSTGNTSGEMLVYLVEEAVLIQGTVYNDANGNGNLDQGEPGLPGVTLTLDDSRTMATDAQGYYAFTVSDPGSHKLVETDPAGFDSTTPNVVLINLGRTDVTVYYGDRYNGGVVVDVKPGSDANPVNLRSNGVLPVAILGSTGLDVMDIDPETILLQGVAPLRWSYADVCGGDGSTYEPLDADGMDDTATSPDGIMDMTLKFDTQAIAQAIEAGGDVRRNDVVTLTLTGYLSGGDPISGTETVRIVQTRKE